MDRTVSEDIKLGLYRHFKGNIYELVGVARHSEKPDLKMAVYRSAKNPEEYWVRPLEMWNEVIQRDGKLIKRFEYIGDKNGK